MSHTATRFGAMAVALTAGFALAACSGGTTPPTSGGEASPPQEKVELTFQQFDPAAQVVGLQAAIDEFNASQDRIHVTMQIVAFADALNTFVREAGAGGGADVLHTAFTWTGDLASNGMIVNLEEYIAQNPPESPVDSFVGKEINTYEGSLYALPFTADSFALTYNPDRLAAAGVTAPPATWEELSDVAAKATSGNQYGLCIPMAGAPGSEIWHATNVYLWSHGSTVAANNGGTWAPGSTDAQLADAITYYKSFLENGSTPQNVLSIPLAGDPVIAEGLANGDCAMSFQVPQQFTISLGSNDKLLSAPLPAGPEGRQLQMGGRSLSINKNSKHPAEAWEFIRYITTKSVFQEHYTNQFPAQSTLLESRSFGPSLASETFAGYTESLLVARTYVEYLGAPSPIPAMWNALVEKFNAAYAGQLTPADAAAQLNAELARQLEG
ncbi:MAG: sugar ABC transporter substrate-binding protein [Propionicimonas sp.]